MSALTDLYSRIQLCQDCGLAKTRTNVVPGEGPENVDILFIGEAPGWNEDQQGRPFVGAAGQFLTHLIQSIQLTRQQVFIANVIKCRPPGNRDPLPGEIEACSKWLDKQIELLSPKLIVTLGRFSLARYFPGESIGKVHGRPRKVGDLVCFPMYHPAAALHQGSLRKMIEEDMLKIPQLLKKMEEVPQAEQQPQAQQLNLF